MKIHFIALSLFALSGCTSALKKKCQETNWFDHGHSVAMKGQRLNSDDFSQACRREGVDPDGSQLDLGFKAGMENYCKPDIAYQTGKKGEFLNLEFCNPGRADTLKKRHREGVLEFCAKDNGYPFGASGKLYNSICPKDLEQAFLKEYRRGRKAYLGQEILGREAQINDLESDISRHEGEKNRLTLELASLPRETTVTRKTINDPLGGNSDELSVTESDQSKSQRNSLRWDIENLNRRIEAAREKQKVLRQQSLEMKREKETLE